MEKIRRMERGDYIRAQEATIEQAATTMNDAALYTHDKEQFQRASTAWREASERWLQAAQGMTPEKAHAVMVGFAATTLKQWMEERRPGPPPSVLTLYNGPISDEEFGQATKGWQ